MHKKEAAAKTAAFFCDNIFECLPLVYYFWHGLLPAEGANLI
jgi:hypothetical protein